MKLLVRLLILMALVPAFAQELAHFNITQQDGLPSNTVYDLIQDSRGFLWVATENGLARYNGFRFREYENLTLRATSASNLLEDNTGRIWMHNFFGEILYVDSDLNSGLKRLDSWEQHYESGFPNLQFFEDTLYVISGRKLFLYHPKGEKWSEVHLADAKNYNHVLITSKKERWVCYTNQDELIVEQLSGTGFKYVMNRADYPMSFNLPRLIEWNGNILLYENRLKRLFCLKNGQIEEWTDRYQTQQKNVRMMKSIGDSLLVFLRPDGLDIVDADGQISLLPGKNVSSFEVDHEGGYWVGTLNEGLFYIPNVHSQLFPKAAYGLFGKLAVSEHYGKIYAGSFNGDIAVFDGTGKFLTSVPNVMNVKKEVQSLFMDERTGRLLVGESFLWQMDVESFETSVVTSAPALKNMVRINDQLLAFATSAGLYYYNDLTKQPHRGALAELRIAALDYDKITQKLWIGTQKGVYIVDPFTQENSLWTIDESGFSPGSTSIKVLPDGTVLIGSTTNGLMVIRKGKMVKHYTTATGLPSNKITAIAMMENQVWVGSEKGIGIVDLQTDEVSVLNSSKGLASSEIYDLVFLGQDLWVSHAAGIQRFLNTSAGKFTSPMVHLNAAISNNELISNPLSGIVLEPESRQLSLELDVSNNLKSHGDCQILYRIAELDHDHWHSITLRDPFVNYQLLPYGEFTLQVKAQNADGINSFNMLSIPISVRTPFWKQTWFVICLILGVMTVFLLIINWRFRELKRKNNLVLLQQNQEQEMRIAQLTSIRAQMNPHFIFNAMALIQGKVLNGQKDAANDQIHNFSMLMRKVLDFSGKEMITLKDEIEVMEMYLAIENDRFDGALAYHVNIEEEVKSEWSMIRIPSLLTQPFVENALRHGLMHKNGPKKLDIDFSMHDDALRIVIRDNGIGRQASSELNKARGKNHQSFAMDAYRKRIDLLNTMQKQKITLEIIDHQNDHGMPTGTSVILQIAL